MQINMTLLGSWKMDARDNRKQGFTCQVLPSLIDMTDEYSQSTF